MALSRRTARSGAKPASAGGSGDHPSAPAAHVPDACAMMAAPAPHSTCRRVLVFALIGCRRKSPYGAPHACGTPSASVGRVAGDGDAVHAPALAMVVVEGAVLRTPVVPDRH